MSCRCLKTAHFTACSTETRTTISVCFRVPYNHCHSFQHKHDNIIIFPRNAEKLHKPFCRLLSALSNVKCDAQEYSAAVLWPRFHFTEAVWFSLSIDSATATFQWSPSFHLIRHQEFIRLPTCGLCFCVPRQTHCMFHSHFALSTTFQPAGIFYNTTAEGSWRCSVETWLMTKSLLKPPTSSVLGLGTIC